MAWINRARITACIVMVSAAAGCETGGQGALSGGAIGALSGLAIGSLSGDAGKGAAIGAIVGAVGGAVIGDQNRRQNEAASAPPPPPPPTSAAAAQYPVSPVLARLVGNWTIQGWVLDEAGRKLDASGSATGTVDKTYFLRMDIRLTDPRSGGPVEGTSVLAQEGGRRISMVNSFSTSPEMRRFEGELDESGTMLSVHQVSPASSATSRRITLRMAGQDQWTAEAWERRGGRDQIVESFTLRRAR